MKITKFLLDLGPFSFQNKTTNLQREWEWELSRLTLCSVEDMLCSVEEMLCSVEDILCSVEDMLGSAEDTLGTGVVSVG